MKVYVAGPYTLGVVEDNVAVAIHAGNRLLDAGHSPYIPHLCHFWHEQISHPYPHWLQLGLDWVSSCDALVRIPGPSPGADLEVLRARNIGIPVFLSVSEFLFNHPKGTQP